MRITEFIGLTHIITGGLEGEMICESRFAIRELRVMFLKKVDFGD